jgi:hypothetical protein
MTSDAALAEARGLYRMLDTGHALEELRECIGAPPNVERMLRRYAAMNSAEARWVEKILKFRNAVANEFELLVRAGDAVSELPEIEEADPDIGKGAFADAFEQTIELRTA